MSLSRRLMAEFVGTFWLVLGGCGSAVLAAGFPKTGIGFLGVALAFGLTLLTMAYAIGHISGCHINPAVSVGLWAGGRFPASEVIPYIIAQVIGGIVAAGVLYVIASGTAGFDPEQRLRPPTDTGPTRRAVTVCGLGGGLRSSNDPDVSLRNHGRHRQARCRRVLRRSRLAWR